MPRSSAPTDAILARRLFEAARLLDTQGQALVNAQLGERLARPALMRLLPFLEAGPIRVTQLAALADVSKQAVAQSLQACVERGLVHYTPDPTDGRAVLVSLTRAGHGAVRQGRRALAEVEQRVAVQIGEPRLRRLTDDLQALIAALQSDNDRP